MKDVLLFLTACALVIGVLGFATLALDKIIQAASGQFVVSNLYQAVLASLFSAACYVGLLYIGES